MAKPSKAKAIARLQKALDAIPALKQLPQRNNSPEFKKWRRNTQVAITNTFGGRDSSPQRFHGHPLLL